eukprot:scaffold913_cov137-Skeletonema_dohrnii-CCMP3373.AAC.17
MRYYCWFGGGSIFMTASSIIEHRDLFGSIPKGRRSEASFQCYRKRVTVTLFHPPQHTRYPCTTKRRWR